MKKLLNLFFGTPIPRLKITGAGSGNERFFVNDEQLTFETHPQLRRICTDICEARGDPECWRLGDSDDVDVRWNEHPCVVCVEGYLRV